MTPEELQAAGLAYEVVGETAVVTLDRPAARNAQTPLTWRTLARIGEEIPDEVRVVLVRGSGQSFSAGLDRAQLEMGRDPAGGGDGVETVAGLLALSDGEASAAIEGFQRGFTWLRDPRFVSVAVVQGHAIGAGFQLALAADLRVAALDAWFAMRETSLGLVPDLGGTGPLVQLVGYARALEICATGRKVSAPEAHGIGLVGTLAPVADLDEVTGSLVEALLAAPAPALRALKPLLRGAVDGDRDGQLAREREAQTVLLQAMLGGSGA
jgi:enoyl-CoA hydratase/carnithine racemase